MKRRAFLKESAMAAAGIAAAGTLRVTPAAPLEAQSQNGSSIVVDPKPLFELSPYLYMQFMEPLGATDGSVEAAWDHLRDRWREDVVAVTRELAPPMMRWGGIFADFYRWREGVGPRDTRPSMLNLLWGGIESNQVGTGEFVDLCRRVGAEPLICVNFESDGRQQYMKVKDSVRTADAQEAAEWVAYCNDPDNARTEGARARGAARTSGTGRSGTRPPTTGTASTSKPRRARPSSLRRRCGRPIRRFSSSRGATAVGRRAWRRWRESTCNTSRSITCSIPTRRRQPVLRGELYRRDPDATWEQLMTAWQLTDAKIRSVRDSLGAPEDSARDDGMPFRRFLAAIAATCLPRGRPACPTRASSTTINATATC